MPRAAAPPRLVEDALERSLSLPARPLRIVSLVPSLTELLFDLGAGDRVIGRTAYCVEPAGRVEAIPALRGPKDPDLVALRALDPDLVLAVKEENHRRDVEELERCGVAVYVADVRTVEDALALVGEIADLVDAEPGLAARVAGAVRDGVERARVIASTHAPVPVFCPVWRDPWLVVGPDTYIADVLRLAGGLPVPEERDPGGRRYPKVTLDEVRAARPVLALLPDEPYPFGAADAAELQVDVHTEQVDGRLVGWYGRRLAGIVEIAERIARAAPSASAAPAAQMDPVQTKGEVP